MYRTPGKFAPNVSAANRSLSLAQRTLGAFLPEGFAEPADGRKETAHGDSGMFNRILLHQLVRRSIAEKTRPEAPPAWPARQAAPSGGPPFPPCRRARRKHFGVCPKLPTFYDPQKAGVKKRLTENLERAKNKRDVPRSMPGRLRAPHPAIAGAEADNKLTAGLKATVEPVAKLRRAVAHTGGTVGSKSAFSENALKGV